MLHQPYIQIKSRLDGISDVKSVKRFNNQYETDGAIVAVPCIFIEFVGALRFETMRKTAQQAPLTVRIHTVSKVHGEVDLSLPDTLIETHEAIADEVYHRLQGFRYEPEPDRLLFSSMNRVEYHEHVYNYGWMLTTQDFECMVFQYPKNEIVTNVLTQINMNYE